MSQSKSARGITAGMGCEAKQTMGSLGAKGQQQLPARWITTRRPRNKWNLSLASFCVRRYNPGLIVHSGSQNRSAHSKGATGQWIQQHRANKVHWHVRRSTITEPRNSLQWMKQWRQVAFSRDCQSGTAGSANNRQLHNGSQALQAAKCVQPPQHLSCQELRRWPGKGGQNSLRDSKSRRI